MHPLDVCNQRNALPSSEVFHAHLQVLPECPTRHAVKVLHHNDESHFAIHRRLFEGRQNDISIVRSFKFARGLESNDSCRHVTEWSDHGVPTFRPMRYPFFQSRNLGVTLPVIGGTLQADRAVKQYEDVNLRLATSTDLLALRELRIEFLAESRGVGPDDFPRRLFEDTRQFFERKQANGRIVSWLVEDGERRMGLASVVMHDVPLPEDPRFSEGYIINMYVRPDFRGKGIGRRLLEACLGIAGDQGIRRFYLYATASGRPMYEQAGFTNHKDWMVGQVPPV